MSGSDGIDRNGPRSVPRSFAYQSGGKIDQTQSLTEIDASETIYDARMRLPQRVVIHKRTHFTEDEEKGLVQGLEGVENIELIEINTEESIRFLASKVQNRKLTIDTFPVARGAAIVLDDNAALFVGSRPRAQCAES